MVAARATELSPAKKPMAIGPRIKDGKQFKPRANPNCKVVFHGTNIREKGSSFHRSKDLDQQRSLEKSSKPPKSLPTEPCEKSKKREAFEKLKGKLPKQSLLPSIVRDKETLVKDISAKKQGNLQTGDFSNRTDKEVNHGREISRRRIELQTGHHSVLVSEIRPSNIRLRSHGPLQNEEGKKLKIPKFSISLTPQEIEQDFLAMTGEKPPRKPQTRGKIFQKKLNENLPGQWLHTVTLDSYNVVDPPNSKKR
ncbi:hypothetical protein H6P81_011967 [Aristolochia fimbriata]|uniref:Uncharacterized protein n=1 Tax=Aristolochia fimbriata TaxID=158543 RepID=A0AAV7EC50_ARIFI|nr:hypothetical protein H6P81_011967 [Aristolochia fimbriata]